MEEDDLTWINQTEFSPDATSKFQLCKWQWCECIVFPIIRWFFLLFEVQGHLCIALVYAQKLTKCVFQTCLSCRRDKIESITLKATNNTMVIIVWIIGSLAVMFLFYTMSWNLKWKFVKSFLRKLIFPANQSSFSIIFVKGSLDICHEVGQMALTSSECIKIWRVGFVSKVTCWVCVNLRITLEGNKTFTSQTTWCIWATSSWDTILNIII